MNIKKSNIDPPLSTSLPYESVIEVSCLQISAQVVIEQSRHEDIPSDLLPVTNNSNKQEPFDSIISAAASQTKTTA